MCSGTPLPMGHGEKSVFLIQRHMELSDEEALAIRWHMGAYDEAYRGGSRALGAAMDCCALVLALHQADMRASQEEKRERGTPASVWRRSRRRLRRGRVMAFRLELSDLPPRYRAQAERQLARGKKRGDPMQEAAARRSDRKGLRQPGRV